MSSSKSILYQPTLIIDIGADNVKFTQPILNSYYISQMLRNEENFTGKNNLNKKGIIWI